MEQYTANREYGQTQPIELADSKVHYQGDRKILQFRFDREKLKEHEQKMLQYNRIEQMLPCVFQFEGKEGILSYDITDLEDWNGQSKRINLEVLVEQLRALLAKLPEYFLEKSGVVFQPETCLYDSQNSQFYFLYLPLRDKKGLQNLDFFRSLYQDIPRLFLQMEMMKENSDLSLADYLEVTKKERIFS